MARDTKSVVRLLVAGLLIAGTASVGAVDGVVLIDQNRALAGGVNPGDAPGFPVTISLPGSYRLSSNLTVANENTTAIDITSTANAVTVDLNGFAIIGPVTCDVSIPPICTLSAADPATTSGPGTGIRSFLNGTLTVRNGTIRGMGRFGVAVVAGAPVVIVDHVQVRDNSLGGLFISSANLTNSQVTRNGGHGVTLNQGVVRGNQITRNGGDGIVSTGQPITVLENQIGLNGGVGINFAATGAYGNNLMFGNLGGSTSGSGVQVSGNVCSGSPCP